MVAQLLKTFLEMEGQGVINFSADAAPFQELAELVTMRNPDIKLVINVAGRILGEVDPIQEPVLSILGN